MSKRQRIVIIGGGFSNKGAEAMLLTLVANIRRRLPQAEVHARLKRRDFEMARRHGLLPIAGDNPRNLLQSTLSKFRTARTYYRGRVFIDISGYQFGDPWGVAGTLRKARSAQRCAGFGNMLFYLPQAWGPFSQPQIAEATRSILDHAQLCYVRDQQSLEAMEELAGKDHPRIRFAHDIAWTFQGDSPAAGRGVLAGNGWLERGSLRVCVTPNLRVYERHDGEGVNNEYVTFLRRMIEYLCKQHGASVCLLGHELRPDAAKERDDRTLCRTVLSTLDDSLPVVHVDKVLGAAEIKGLIGNCGLLISSRYHALIAALSQGIPVAAIGWSHKYNELLKEAGLPWATVPVDHDGEKMAAMVDRICESRSASKQMIDARLPELRRSGQEAMDEVLGVIQREFEG